LFGRYNLIRFERDGKHLFVRPEDITLDPKGAAGLEGIVNKVVFLGSYYELEVLVPGNSITVRTGNRSFVKGDTVTISLPSHPHYIT